MSVEMNESNRIIRNVIGFEKSTHGLKDLGFYCE